MNPKQHFAKRGDDLRCNPERRRQMRLKRVEWLKTHRAEIEHMSSTALALRMKQEGLYAQGTALVDVKIGLTKICSEHGILCSACPAAYSKAHGVYSPEARHLLR